jgi:hypothetical protein
LLLLTQELPPRTLIYDGPWSSAISHLPSSLDTQRQGQWKTEIKLTEGDGYRYCSSTPPLPYRCDASVAFITPRPCRSYFFWIASKVSKNFTLYTTHLTSQLNCQTR